MNKYQLTLSYDGTDYFGWQKQQSRLTIEQQLLKTFMRVFKQEASILGASRTDAGVHALGQVALLRTPLRIDTRHLMDAWNNSLPKDIVITSAQQAHEFFHPHHRVNEKTYQYDLFVHRPLPVVQRFGWYYDFPIDFEKLYQGLLLFIGTYDFRSFCTGDDMTSTMRTIRNISLDYIENLDAYRITIQGPSFLRYMIRRLVGAAVEIASRPKLSIDLLHETLHAKDPRHSLPCAPAKGLTLVNILYHEPTPPPIDY